jgi:hypothetical protein
MHRNRLEDDTKLDPVETHYCFSKFELGYISTHVQHSECSHI